MSNGGTITFACDGTIALSAPLVVDCDTILDGSGRQVTLSGNNAVRVLEVYPGVRCSVRALTIANGAVIGTNAVQQGAPGENAFGAGILNRGILTAVDCFFTSNVVRGGSGAPGNSGVTNGNGGAACGGAINNDAGEVWATNCVFTANTSIGGTGGFFFVTLVGGPGGDAFGGAFASTMGAYGLAACQFSSNHAVGGTPGGQGVGQYGKAGFAYGGAIGSIHSTGAVSDGVLIANASTGASVFWNSVGFAEAQGGAIFNSSGRLSVIRTLLASNTCASGAAARNGIRGLARGGAIANGSGGVLVMTDSYFRNNTARADTSIRGEPIHAFGGGLDNLGNASATRCTFEANQAIGALTQNSVGGPYPGGNAYGGAVYTSEAFAATNCTFAGNVARGGGSSGSGGLGGNGSGRGGAGNGGALAARGVAFLSHVTIGSNIAVNGIGLGDTQPASGYGGGIYASNSAPVLQNTIIAYSQIGSNAFGVLIDEGNNFSSDGSCRFIQEGSRNNVDPLLSPLADFGGPTPTMALLAGSPAIDAGLTSVCVPTDQRGRLRPYGAGCDAGAFESSPPFTLRGMIRGKPQSGVTIQAGIFSALSDSVGNYIVFGLSPGDHNLVPTSLNGVFIPNSRTVSVASDILGIDFKAYPFNGLTIDAVSDQEQTVVLAGRPADTFEVQTSQGIAGPWTILSTNTIGPNGIVTFQAPLNGSASYLRARRLAP